VLSIAILFLSTDWLNLTSWWQTLLAEVHRVQPWTFFCKYLA